MDGKLYGLPWGGHPGYAGLVYNEELLSRAAAAHAELEAAEEAGLDPVAVQRRNVRILDATAKKLGLPAEKVVATIDRHGNPVGRPVTVLLDQDGLPQATRDGRLRAAISQKKKPSSEVAAVVPMM